MHIYAQAQKFLGKISTTFAHISDEERERLLNYAMLVWLSIPTAFGFCLNALLSGQITLATIITLVTGMQVLGWKLIRNGVYPESVFRLNFWLFAGLLLYLADAGGDGGSKALWLYTGPLFAFALLRTREAGIASLILGTAAIVIMQFAKYPDGQLIYSQQFIVRFAVTLLIQIAATSAFNSIRHRYWRNARKAHQALEIEKVKLDEEIERRTRAEADLQRLASTDPLCNIPNRRAFMQAAEQEMARHLRSGQPLCLAILDVDHFKQINDHFGHPQGDIVLHSIAQRIECRIREGDHFGRIGGEEFALLLVNTPVREGATLANRLRQAMAEQVFILDEQDCRVTISIGIHQVNFTEETLSDALQQADHALYVAKRNGRNCVEVFNYAPAQQQSLPLSLAPDSLGKAV